MTNAIYIGNFGGNRSSDVFTILKDFLTPYCGSYRFPVGLTDRLLVFDEMNHLHMAARSTLERSLVGSNNGFLHNIALVAQPRTYNLLGKLDFAPEYAIGLLTVSEDDLGKLLEPESIRDGNFSLDIAKALKQGLGCRYCVVLMNDPDISKWQYIRDR